MRKFNLENRLIDFAVLIIEISEALKKHQPENIYPNNLFVLAHLPDFIMGKHKVLNPGGISSIKLKL